MSTPTMTGSTWAGFPFPFTADEYRYSTNVEPANTPVQTPVGQWGASVIAVDEQYLPELTERAAILRRDPSRSAALPHMRPACWDAVLTVLTELATSYPASFTLTGLGAGRWRWHNSLAGDELEFTYGDDATLPLPPLQWISTQMQEDIVLLDQRDQLYGDAGVVTFAADWSMAFDVGMSLLEIHGPVPRVRETGVITRAHEFIKRLQPHEPYRRTNWSMTIGHRMDVATEIYPEWGPDRAMIGQVDDAKFGELLHLRVEVQHLIRLADSGAIMFLIRTYMMPLQVLAAIEPWRDRAAKVLAELPQDMAEYKGILKFRDRAAAWLKAHGPMSELPPQVPSTPDFPSAPEQVDETGTSFLILAIGANPVTGAVAREWTEAAKGIGPTTLGVLDTIDHPQDRATFDSLLARARTGVRVMLTGGEYDVLQTLSLLRAHGALDAVLRHRAQRHPGVLRALPEHLPGGHRHHRRLPVLPTHPGGTRAPLRAAGQLPGLRRPGENAMTTTAVTTTAVTTTAVTTTAVTTTAVTTTVLPQQPLHQRDEDFLGHQHPGYALGKRTLTVARLTHLTDAIVHIELADPDGGPLAPYQPGSHLVLDAGEGRRNAYSLTGDGFNPRSYEISVLRCDEGAGGSVWLHEHLTVGALVQVEGPRSMFPTAHEQRHALLVAGGIGVTPILSHARAIARSGASATVLYSYRRGHEAHLDELRALTSSSIELVEASTVEATSAALRSLLARQPFGTHAYACGPEAMLNAYTEAATLAGWPAGRVHAERFVAPELDPGQPFSVTVESTGQQLEIPSGGSLLDGLLDAGIAVNYLCKQGVCGECKLPVSAASSLEHRDFVLTEQERATGAHIMACVSRGRDIHLDL